MSTNRLQQLHDAGVSIWLDFIDRELLSSGRLRRMIEEDSITGETTNPTIFEKALAEGHEYDDQLGAAPRELTPADLFELVETEDVRAACDIFADVYARTDGGDGYVSIEVSPASANDAEATVREAQRLWRAVDRPNLMVKVPGTNEGAAAVRQLIGQGINVNITLLFAINAHARVIDAYIAGLEDRLRAGNRIDRVASVASFFVSRVDTEVDKRLEELAARATGAGRSRILNLRGKAAIANAKLAYRLFEAKFSGERWERLAAKGARLQRPLWASTGTKNPAYKDTLYVEELIGPNCVNTVPPATLDAFRDHGEVRQSISEGLDQAQLCLAELESAGVSLEEVTDKLLADGLASFQKSFDQLTAGLAKKMSLLVHAT
ncbi:MAG TPA: transaldolase [Gemmatimonadaceae bacterium]|nr:transaldolase [Gemmatimonadaceae bacterium]